MAVAFWDFPFNSTPLFPNIVLTRSHGLVLCMKLEGGWWVGLVVTIPMTSCSLYGGFLGIKEGPETNTFKPKTKQARRPRHVAGFGPALPAPENHARDPLRVGHGSLSKTPYCLNSRKKGP